MLHATELLGAEARDAQGNFVGRVRELFLVPADHPGSSRESSSPGEGFSRWWRGMTRWPPPSPGNWC